MPYVARWNVVHWLREDEQLPGAGRRPAGIV
jgi:hypothetical protein